MNFEIHPKAWLAALVALFVLILLDGGTMVYISVVAKQSVPSFLETAFSGFVMGFLGLLAVPRKDSDASPDNETPTPESPTFDH